MTAVISNHWQVGDVNRERNWIALACVGVYVCACSPVEVDAFLCDLAGSVFGVCARFIADDLHPFTSFALFIAVLADHIKLTDLILRKRDFKKSRRVGFFIRCTAIHPAPVNGRQ